MAQSPKQKWTRVHTAALIIITALGAACGIWIPPGKNLFMWLALFALLFLFAVITGWGITGLPIIGWLLNEENRLSLSRLQMFLWTFVVLSAFLAAAFINFREGIKDPLAIKIPEQLWIAMGIGTTSLVGTPLILNVKKQKKISTAVANKYLNLHHLTRANGVKGAKQESRDTCLDGSLVRNGDPKEAGSGDLIRGEEISNASIVDLTRLQNLFFTLVLVGAYAGSLFTLFKKCGPVTEFPALDGSSLALLGISHAGFLAGKTVDKQPAGNLAL